MSILKNLNEHYVGIVSYSALWGYTAPDGREYAILGCRTGTAFIDITDTLNIREAGFVPALYSSNSGSMWREMKTYSHYAYIVSEEELSGIQIVDLQYLPDSIRYVGRKFVPGHKTTHTISQEGPYLYLSGTNIEMGKGIAIVDLSSNPENPVLRSIWNTYGVHDCRVLRDTIYACNLGDNLISIIDARNKDNPVTLNSFTTTPVINPHNCAVSNDRKYLYSTDETTGGKLKIWNIEDIYNPVLIKIYNPMGFSSDVIHNVELYGNIVVLAYYTAGVQVVDVSNPANPVCIGFNDFYSGPTPDFWGCWAVYKFPGSGKIIASDRTNGLYVLRNAPPPASIPVANFLSDSPAITIGGEVGFFDISSGNPSSRIWTITGPQNFNSTAQNPRFSFTAMGNY
ncbi:MAG: choice-of-anchor B family protein [Ignavibacteria bacterium]|nr:choice-of-anchor B family protein [Ignavibacteria bacterium]